ncbi:MAG TPA: hypothetical protein VGK02_08535 [Candidatus Aquicultor sp.]|jgi:hypothetical protein
MGSKPARSKKALIATFGLILLAVILALIAPEEKTLGSYIRLIYIHAAVTWVGMLMFAISGLYALLLFFGFLLDKSAAHGIKDVVVAWSSASQVTAIWFWTASVVLGSFAARLTWGGNWWIEPRLRVAAFILVLAFVIYQLRQMIANVMFKAALNLSLPVASVILLASTGKLVHPNNAFAQSDSIEIKASAAIITILFAIVSVISMRLLITREHQRGNDLELAGF